MSQHIGNQEATDRILCNSYHGCTVSLRNQTHKSEQPLPKNFDNIMEKGPHTLRIKGYSVPKLINNKNKMCG